MGMEGTQYSVSSVVVVLEARESGGLVVSSVAGSVGAVVGSESGSSKIQLSVGRERCRGDVLMGWENQMSLYNWMLKMVWSGCGRGA